MLQSSKERASQQVTEIAILFINNRYVRHSELRDEAAAGQILSRVVSSCAIGPPVARVGVKIAAVAARRNEAGTNSEITKVFVFLTVARISAEHWLERGNYSGVIEILSVQFVQSRTVKGSAEVEVVTPRSLTHQSDLSEVGARTAIGAARHTDDDIVGR